jgi:ABC-2 type transport system ATP-binding protein
VPTPVFAFEIARLGDATITAPSTRDAESVPAVLEGSGVLEVTMHHVGLLPGPHVLHTEVTDFGRQHVYDHVQTALSFDVTAGDSHEVNGLVTLRPHWTLAPRG